MDAFATYTDLELRLKRTFTPDEQTWIASLLEDASTYLRGVIGYDIYPQAVVTYTDYPDGGRIDLPQFPIIAITTVERDSVELDYEYRPGYILVDTDLPVDITFTYGYAAAPPELVRLTCVLVSQALITLENDLGLTAGGLSSVALDDFKLAWANAGASSGMVLPPIQEAAVRRQFGKGDLGVVGTR